MDCFDSFIDSFIIAILVAVRKLTKKDQEQIQFIARNGMKSTEKYLSTIHCAAEEYNANLLESFCCVCLLSMKYFCSLFFSKS